MRGRKPIPNHLKLVAGNPGKRALNDQEAKPKVKYPKCPSHIIGAARKEWLSMSRKLMQCGLLSEIDGAALAAYCDAYGRWAEASQKLAQFGMVMKGAMKDTLVQSPYLIIVNRAVDQMRSFLIEFGMTPSSRSRIKVGGEAPRSLGDIASARADAVRSRQG